MNWHAFPYFLSIIGGCWLWACLPRNRHPAAWVAAGVLLLGVFIGCLWHDLGRPPMRTLGETRLWFGLLLPSCGLLAHRCVKWRWPLHYASGIGFLFLLITALRTETHDRTLMPALQSPLFVPHVVLYLIAYAFLIYTAAVAGTGWWQARRGGATTTRHLSIAEASLWMGFSFLTLGLVAGAVWAKEAWGHYWTWDPKETWAFLTWGVYLCYFHLRPEWTRRPRRALGFLALASVVVLLCWFGVNYMPSAAVSVHTYSR
jgi:ABC-type transport system involved in cytochrome c biogenesis permease subunit